MSYLSRREFLATAAAASATSALPALLAPIRKARAATATTLHAATRVIEVNGRAATVFGLMQPDGQHGLATEAGQRFDVRLENRLDEHTLIHWHGLTPPWQQDGVPDLSQPALPPGASYVYDFPLARPGTHWMHSHHGLQEQRMLAAPLVVADPAERGADVQDVVVMFHDFTFRAPGEVLAALQGGGGGHGAHGVPAVDHAAMGHGSAAVDHAAMGHGSAGTDPAATGQGTTGMDHAALGHGAGVAGAHLHDVEYDAFLANDRSLDDPQVQRVERGGRVRLRLINAAAATGFWIDLGGLEGRLVAVDGVAVEPITGHRFEFAIAQRLDIVLQLPRE